MHVRSLTLTVTLSFTLTFVACDGPPKPTPPPSPSLSSSASTGSPVALTSAPPPAPALVAASRQVMDAALVLANKCRLVSLAEVSESMTDYCGDWRPAEVKTMHDSAAKLAAFSPLPTSGAGASFVAEARLFAEWIDLIGVGTQHGTLAHYQELASAWNAWLPADKFLIDPIGISKSRAGVTLGGTDGGVIHWQHCSEGPCVVVGKVP